MQKFSIITLIHNQENNLPRILISYSEQSFQPFEYVFVLDRCTDNSKEIILEFLESHSGVCIENTVGYGFMAGYCRNLGLLSIDNPELILFLDGDCVLASNQLFENAYFELSNNNSSIVLFSRLFEKKESSEIESVDRRMMFPWVKNKVFVNGINHKVIDTYVSRWKALVISCCFGMNITAINFVRNINNNLYGDDGLFPHIFDGNWGGEDEYIGWIAMLFNFNVIAINPSIHVIHIWHETRCSTTYETTANLAYDSLVEYALSVDAPGIENILVDLNMVAFDVISDIVKLKKGQY